MSASIAADTPTPANLHHAIQTVLERTPKRAPATPSKDHDDGAARARRIAAVVLDVLAGNRSPSEAARALGVSCARYYLLEKQAIAGLVAGCQSRPVGRQRGSGKEVDRLAAENRRLTQNLLRQQALVRAGQRSLGVAAPPRPAPSAAQPGRGKGKRRPTVRALRVAKRLNAATSTASTPPPTLTGDRSGG